MPYSTLKTTIRISIFADTNRNILRSIAGWCIENEINYAIRFSELEYNVIVDADTATLLKLKFPI